MCWFKKPPVTVVLLCRVNCIDAITFIWRRLNNLKSNAFFLKCWSSSEELYDLNKSVHLEITPDPNSDKVLYKIDPDLSRGVRKVLLNTITEIATKNKISVSS